MSHHLENSIWVSHPDFRDHLFSPEGNVLSVQQRKVMKTGLRGKGYPCTVLRKGSVRRTCSIHRIIAELFVENPDRKPQVNHKDGNKINNSYLNLEWVSRSENIRHKLDVLGHKNVTGESHGMSKLSIEDVQQIRTMLQNGCSLQKTADRFLVSKKLVWSIKHGRLWRGI